MASSREYLIYVLELLNKCDNITYKKMMGEYLLYSNGVLFGGIYDDRLLIKITSSNNLYNFQIDTPYVGAKNMYFIDLEDSNDLFNIISNVIKDLS